MNTLDMRLIALGVPAETLAEVRGLLRANGAGMVELLLQKKVLPEAELLAAFGDGSRKVLSGVTTIEEVFRVTRIIKRETEGIAGIPTG
jgi:hypothetical protein